MTGSVTPADKAGTETQPFEIDVLACPRCSGRMRILAAIVTPEAIRAILDCLGFPSRAPPTVPAERDERVEVGSGI